MENLLKSLDDLNKQIKKIILDKDPSEYYKLESLSDQCDAIRLQIKNIIEN